MVNVFASHAVGRRFAPRSDHTTDHHRNATNSLPTWHAYVRVRVLQCILTVLSKGRVMCGTVYWDMYIKDFLGSISRVGYCIPVPDF